MLFSRYTHKFFVGSDVALYNSLRMKPVFLTRDKFKQVETFLGEVSDRQPVVVPFEVEQEVQELLKYKIR